MAYQWQCQAGSGSWLLFVIHCTTSFPADQLVLHAGCISNYLFAEPVKLGAHHSPKYILEVVHVRVLCCAVLLNQRVDHESFAFETIDVIISST